MKTTEFPQLARPGDYPYGLHGIGVAGMFLDLAFAIARGDVACRSTVVETRSDCEAFVEKTLTFRFTERVPRTSTACDVPHVRGIDHK